MTDAIRLITYCTGLKITYAEVKADFLAIYPSLETKLMDTNVFGAMTSLETASKAAAEAYLSYEQMHKGELSKETVVPIETSSTTTTERNQRADSTSTTSISARTSRLRTTVVPIETSSTTTTERNQRADSTSTTSISEINHKVYEKELAQIGPRKGSTRSMCETVEQVERRKLSHGQIPKTDENIWKTSEEKMRNQRTGSISSTPTCHNCGKQGHLQRECPSCTYCKKYGHSSKDCRKRISEAKGKFCAKCKMKDSHNTDECRRQAIPNKTVKMIHQEEEDHQQDAWDSITYEDNQSDQSNEY